MPWRIVHFQTAWPRQVVVDPVAYDTAGEAAKAAAANPLRTGHESVLVEGATTRDAFDLVVFWSARRDAGAHVELLDADDPRWGPHGRPDSLSGTARTSG